MKKALIILSSLLIASTAFGSTPEGFIVGGGKVLSGSVLSGNLTYFYDDSTKCTFTISGPGPGVVQITLGQDQTHNCIIQMQDGFSQQAQMIYSKCTAGYSVTYYPGDDSILVQSSQALGSHAPTPEFMPNT